MLVLSRFAMWASLVLTLVVFARTPVCDAQESANNQKTVQDEKPKVDPLLGKQLGTPRDTMRTFLDAINAGKRGQAAQCLASTRLSAKSRNLAAWKLKGVIDRMWWVNFDEIKPNEPFAIPDSASGLKDDADRKDAGSIVITQGADGLWRFSPETVNAIGGLYARWEERPVVEGAKRPPEPVEVWLRNRFPKAWRDTTFILHDYQWACLLAVIVIGLITDLLVRGFLHYLATAWFKYLKTETDFQPDRAIWKPVGLLSQALVWYGGTSLIGLPDMVLLVLLIALKFFAVVAAVWTAFLLIDLMARFFTKKAAMTATKFDDLLVPMISKSLKVFVVLVGLVTIAQAFNLPVAGLLGGLGLGGMAFAFAAQDSIKHLFGSVMILSDRPFEVGDRIQSGDNDGSVETVGFRSTQIRTPEGHLVSIPNGDLANGTIRNIAKRPNIRRVLNLGVTYDTSPEKVEEAIQIVKDLLDHHDGQDADFPPRVFFNDYTESTLNIFVIYWYHPADWWSYNEFSERLNMEILKRFNAAGIEFAFPSQTVYLAGDSGDTPEAA